LSAGGAGGASVAFGAPFIGLAELAAGAAADPGEQQLGLGEQQVGAGAHLTGAHLTGAHSTFSTLQQVVFFFPHPKKPASALFIAPKTKVTANKEPKIRIFMFLSLNTLVWQSRVEFIRQAGCQSQLFHLPLQDFLFLIRSVHTIDDKIRVLGSQTGLGQF